MARRRGGFVRKQPVITPSASTSHSVPPTSSDEDTPAVLNSPVKPRRKKLTVNDKTDLEAWELQDEVIIGAFNVVFTFY
jgi:hypothetical protein